MHLWERLYLSAAPSIAYAASVHGVPMNPSTVEASPTFVRSADRICRMKGRLLSGSSSMRSSRSWSSLHSRTTNILIVAKLRRAHHGA